MSEAAAETRPPYAFWPEASAPAAVPPPSEHSLILAPDDDVLSNPLLARPRRRPRARVALALALHWSHDIYLCAKALIALMCVIDLAYRLLAFKDFFSAAQIAVMAFVVAMLAAGIGRHFLPQSVWADLLPSAALFCAAVGLYFAARRGRPWQFGEKRSDWVWQLARAVFLFYLVARLVLWALFAQLALGLLAVKGRRRLRRWQRERARLRSLARLAPVPFAEWRDVENFQGLTACPICLGELDAARPLAVLPGCSHSFHHDCILRWVTGNDSCPMCKKEVLAHL